MRAPPRIIRGHSFKRFNVESFRNDLANVPWSVCSIFDDPDYSYWAWNKIYGDICDLHAPFREVKLRSVLLPWISPQLRHKIIQTIFKGKKDRG